MEEDPLSLLEMLPLEIVRLVHDEACKDGLAALPFSMLNTFANLHFPFDKFAKDPHSILNRCAELGYIGYCRWYSSAFAKDRLRASNWFGLSAISVANAKFDFYTYLKLDTGISKPQVPPEVWSRLISSCSVEDIRRFSETMESVDTFPTFYRGKIFSDMLSQGRREVIYWLLDESDDLAKKFGLKTYAKETPSEVISKTAGVLSNKKVIGPNGSRIEIVRTLVEKYGLPFRDSAIVLWSPCAEGDYQVLRFLTEYGISLNRAPYTFDLLEYAVKSGSLDCVRLLLEKGVPRLDRIVAAAAELGNVTILKCLTLEAGIPYRRDTLMDFAMRSLKEDMWEFALRDLGCDLTSSCYASVLRDREQLAEIERAWSWLKRNKCPFDLETALHGALRVGAKAISFLFGIENVKLTDEHLQCLFYGKYNRFACSDDDIVYALTKARPDYKVDRKFLKLIFGAYHLDKLVSNLRLLKTIAYEITREDFVWLLGEFDFQGSQRNRAFLRSKALTSVILNGQFKNCDDTLYQMISSEIEDDMRREEGFEIIKKAGRQPKRELFKIDEPGLLFGNLF